MAKASFIFLEPSCDIHLVLDPNFKRGGVSLNDVELKVFRGEFNAVDDNYSISQVNSDLHFDFFPINQTHINFDPVTRIITPQSYGTILMQVRYEDPADPTEYIYTLARIQVHDKLNGWWFGNKSLSVFWDPDMDHSQLSIFALMDSANADKRSIVDISGHGYVELSSDDEFTVKVSNTYRGRVSGVIFGTANITGVLLGGDTETVPVTCVDFADLTPVKRLDRTHVFNAAGKVEEKLNIVILAEGFRDNPDDRALYRKAVTPMIDAMFTTERHAPFNILKDKFNFWKAYTESPENGLTVGVPVNIDGDTIPGDVDPASSCAADSYTLEELNQKVGYPTNADTTKSIVQLKSNWSTAGSAPKLAGYVDAKACNNVIEAWKKQKIHGIPQARDTYWCFMQGARWGERSSEFQAKADIVAPNLAEADTHADNTRFAEWVHKWYKPKEPPSGPEFDPRRFAPELGANNRTAPKRDFLLKEMERFADKNLNFGDNNFQVGKVWGSGFTPDSTATTRQYSSIGLGVLMINHRYLRGVNFSNTFFAKSIGRESLLEYTVDPSPTKPKLTIKKSASTNNIKFTNTVVHELGHSFNLNDEYEEFRKAGDDGEEDYDNTTVLSNIEVTAAPADATKPRPIDPDKVKWVNLHRIEKSSGTRNESAINANKVVFKIDKSELNNWKVGDTINFRSGKGFEGLRIPQVPIDTPDIYLNMTIDSIDAGSGEVTLSGGPAVKAPFPPGSLMYKAKEEDGNIIKLVEKRVYDFMKNNSYSGVATNGRALTENHDTHASGSDPVSKDFDAPPDVPSYKPPCDEYKVIGIYEGGGAYTIDVFRPSGGCKMRDGQGDGGEGEYCFVCKYMMVNRIDPSKHAKLDSYYPDGKQKKVKKDK
ncbi:MAG: hypothetical protein KDC34_09785 [Saprospiraceae bacterium]|nr:hypothetical protein [Saprospiraceae bacterium]